MDGLGAAASGIAVVEVVKKSAVATNKATRMFGSFKIVCKKRDIKDFKSQLHDTIGLLNLAMTTNFTWADNPPKLGLTLLKNEVLFIPKALAICWNRSQRQIRWQHPPQRDYFLQEAARQRELTMGLSSLLKSASKAVEGRWDASLRRLNQLQSPFSPGPWGRYSFDEKSEFQLSEMKRNPPLRAPTREAKSNWVFIPSFLPYAFDFRYLNTCGYIERALRTYLVLPYNHPVWKLCRRGNRRGPEASWR